MRSNLNILHAREIGLVCLLAIARWEGRVRQERRLEILRNAGAQIAAPNILGHLVLKVEVDGIFESRTA